MRIKTLGFSLMMIIASIAAAKSTRSDCGPIDLSVTEWPQFRFDFSHTGYNPYESILSPNTVGNLVLKWKEATGASITSSPSVLKGVAMSVSMIAIP